MHYYHSILDDEGKHVELTDDVYPLVPCDTGGAEASPWVTKKYCPAYDFSKIKIGKSYATNEQTWMRLALHLCDTKARAKEGKICASR